MSLNRIIQLFCEGLHIEESINDKNLLKAVIMAGGPGSGKSFIRKQIFPNIKTLNSDDFFEYLLKKKNLSMDVDVSNPDSDQMFQRDRAKSLTSQKQKTMFNGMLPVIIDGTGKSYDKIYKQKTELEANGYDVSMVFVNTDLETAQKRNSERDRRVSPDFVEKSWQSVMNNMGKFQSLFKDDFFIVDNSDGAELSSKTFSNIYRKSIESPLRNRLGLKILKQVAGSGSKYRDDLKDVGNKSSEQNS